MMKAQRVLLVDVGSASVGVCVAEEQKGALTISHVARTQLQNASGQNTPAIAALAVEALKKSLTALAAVSPAPKTAHVFLAAPWYEARIKAVNLRSDKLLKITKATVEKALREHAEKERAPAGRIESAVSQMYVNGYPTAIAKTLHGNSLSINLYESEADTAFVENIQSAVRAVAIESDVVFHSFPFALFTVLRALRDEENFIALDIGGEITDMVLANRDSVRFVGSFPFGALSLLRSVAGKKSPADAASRLSLYAKGELSTEERAAFGALFEKAAASWNEEYRKLLESASFETPLPYTTFLLADKEELSWFGAIIANAKSAFVVRPIPVNPDFFQNAVSLGEKGSYDAFLSIEALYTFKVTK